MQLHITNLNLIKFLAVLLIAVTSATAVAQDAAIDAIIKREMNAQHIPGVQVSVSLRGKTVFSKSYGMASVEDSVPVDNKTIFAINSCTKSFTGVAVMQLVEEGKIELEAPISRYLGDLPVSWQPITIKQLLTHVSGLPDILWLTAPKNLPPGQSLETWTWEEIKTKPFDFPTGDQMRYNQTNYFLLGRIITKLTGKHFTEFFAERQFQVVGMPGTAFGDSRDVINHFAPTYRYVNTRDGENIDVQKIQRNYSEFPSFVRAGSGLNSTADDLAKWTIALQQGKLFKDKTTLKTMWTVGSHNNGSPTQWALGWGITKLRAKHNAIGMSGGGRSAFLIYPDDELAIVVLTNLGGSSPEDFIEEIAGCYNPDIVAADPITFLRTNLPKRGFNRAIDVVKEQQKKDPTFQPDEDELNDWGYRLMGKGSLKEAMEVFKLNIHLFPESWNTYDSYGDALLRDGQKELAIQAYTKSVTLNPNNLGGKKVLERISASKK